MKFVNDPRLPLPTDSEYDKLCKAYEKGKKDKRAGKSIVTCPFPPNKGTRGQTERGAWIRGWLSENKK